MSRCNVKNFDHFIPPRYTDKHGGVIAAVNVIF